MPYMPNGRLVLSVTRVITYVLHGREHHRDRLYPCRRYASILVIKQPQ